MNKFLLIVLLILALCQGQGYRWEIIKRTHTVWPKSHAGVEYKKLIKELKYNISCTRECDFYLLTDREYSYFKDKKQFEYIKYEQDVTQVKGEYNSASSKHFWAVVVNNDAKESLTADFELERYAENKDWITIVALVSTFSFLGVCVFVGVLGICIKWRVDIINWVKNKMGK